VCNLVHLLAICLDESASVFESIMDAIHVAQFDLDVLLTLHNYSFLHESLVKLLVVDLTLTEAVHLHQ
jgi:hypothetical protein